MTNPTIEEVNWELEKFVDSGMMGKVRNLRTNEITYYIKAPAERKKLGLQPIEFDENLYEVMA